MLAGRVQTKCEMWLLNRQNLSRQTKKNFLKILLKCLTPDKKTPAFPIFKQRQTGTSQHLRYKTMLEKEGKIASEKLS